MKRQIIHTDKAPAAVGPYSQAVKVGNLLFVSGQVALDPATGELIAGDIEAQTKKIMANIQTILDAAGTSLEKVVKATIFLTDMGDFARVNKIYGSYFPAAPPARSCVQVAGLPKGAPIEIEVIAQVE